MICVFAVVVRFRFEGLSCEPNSQLNHFGRWGWHRKASLGPQVSVAFCLACVRVVFGSVSVAEWPPFGRWLLTRLTICSLCILTICNISYFPFWF